MLLETKTRELSLAVKLVDDLNANIITDGNVSLKNNIWHHLAIKKTDGFYVFTDIQTGSYTLSVNAQDYQYFEHDLSVPLPASSNLLVNVPGQNEIFLAVQSSNTSTETITFASRNFYRPVVAGTPVISSRRLAEIASTIDGESVSEAILDDVGSGPSRIRTNDIVRLIGERVIRMKPSPHYAFNNRLRRLVGSVRESATDLTIPEAQVEISHVNTQVVNADDVGTTPANTVRIVSIGNGINKRVIGTIDDIRRKVNKRGAYVFYFPQRNDLDISNVTITVSAPGFATLSSIVIELTAHIETSQTIFLTRV